MTVQTVPCHNNGVLPADLLAEVFGYLVLPSGVWPASLPGSASSSRAAFMGVSRPFHDVAIGFAPAWTNIGSTTAVDMNPAIERVEDTLQGFEKILQRGFQRPLSLSVSFVGAPEHYRRFAGELVKILGSHSTRLRRIRWSIDDNIVDLSPLLQIHLADLQEFVAGGGRSAWKMICQPPPLAMPNLKRLKLVEVGVTFEQVRMLFIHMPGDCALFLGDCSIEHLPTEATVIGSFAPENRLKSMLCWGLLCRDPRVASIQVMVRMVQNLRPGAACVIGQARYGVPAELFPREDDVDVVIEHNQDEEETSITAEDLRRGVYRYKMAQFQPVLLPDFLRGLDFCLIRRLKGLRIPILGFAACIDALYAAVNGRNFSIPLQDLTLDCHGTDLVSGQPFDSQVMLPSSGVALLDLKMLHIHLHGPFSSCETLPQPGRDWVRKLRNAIQLSDTLRVSLIIWDGKANR